MNLNRKINLKRNENEKGNKIKGKENRRNLGYFYDLSTILCGKRRIRATNNPTESLLVERGAWESEMCHFPRWVCRQFFFFFFISHRSTHLCFQATQVAGRAQLMLYGVHYLVGSKECYFMKYNYVIVGSTIFLSFRVQVMTKESSSNTINIKVSFWRSRYDECNGENDSLFENSS